MHLLKHVRFFVRRRKPMLINKELRNKHVFDERELRRFQFKKFSDEVNMTLSGGKGGEGSLI